MPRQGPANGSPSCGRIPKFGRVSAYMRNVLHWLPYPQRIVYCVAALVRRCMEGLAPPYLREQCCPTVTIERLISLRSSAQGELLVPRSRTVIRQRRAFSVAGPIECVNSIDFLIPKMRGTRKLWHVMRILKIFCSFEYYQIVLGKSSPENNHVLALLTKFY